MFEIEKCTVRLALPKDRGDLIEISKRIWEGHDYLPKIVDRWIDEPWFFVCEYEGKVIACLKLSQFPDQVIWFEGLRVHYKYQGKGVAKLMNKELLRFASGLKLQNPALSFEFCTYYKNTESINLTSKLGSQQVDGFFNMEKRGIHKVSKPEFVRDFGCEIFEHYPKYLPLNWHTVHSQVSSLKFIRQHAQVFKTPNSIYLIGEVGERCITFLDSPHPKLKEDLPYLQYFFGKGKHISVTMSSMFKSNLAWMRKHNFYFWDDEGEEALNMLVFILPS